jgi:hypothetical protein
MRTRLPEGQIKAQYQKARIGKSPGQRGQKLRLAIRPGAMRQGQDIAIRVRGLMQKATDGRFSGMIEKFVH